MFNSLMMFLAPECPAAQATPSSPPASAPPSRLPRARVRPALRLATAVAANTAGFGLLMAWCWLSLRLAQAWLA